MKIKTKVISFIQQRIDIAESIRNASEREKTDSGRLRRINNEVFAPLLDYESSVLNPDISGSFGAALGAEYHEAVLQAMRDLPSPTGEYVELLDRVSRPSATIEDWRREFLSFKRKRARTEGALSLTADFLSDFNDRALTTTDPADETVLYRYGNHVDPNEVQLFRFLLGFSPVQLERMAEHVVDAFLHGFISQNRTIKNRRVVQFTYQAGQEPLARKVIEAFTRRNLAVRVRSVGGLRQFVQFESDHRHDRCLYIDGTYAGDFVAAFEAQAAAHEQVLREICGNATIIQFGRTEAPPQRKEHACASDHDCSDIISRIVNGRRECLKRYILPGEVSSCKAALPAVEIGHDFPRIFTGVLELNTSSSGRTEELQQMLIDVLDDAVAVRVRGQRSKGNSTDIEVKMQPLVDPARQTNFLNGGGDINIPHGEVFTTPALQGTNGLLHFRKVFAKGTVFEDLRIHFTNGVADDWSCRNHPDPEEAQGLVRSVLFFPHKTVPIGEFAIGTNTAAYRFARDNELMTKLPPLLIEKMGPHFALGDPCFARSEDDRVYNLLGGKEVTAKENEKTRQRHSEPATAYTNIHIDLTIPYDEIEYIQAISVDGAVDIVRNGRFALPCLLELNDPLSAKDT